MATGDRDGPREPRRPYLLPSGHASSELAERDFFVVLRRRGPDGSEVATFFRAMGAAPAAETEQRAWEDFGGRG